MAASRTKARVAVKLSPREALNQTGKTVPRLTRVVGGGRVYGRADAKRKNREIVVANGEGC